MTFAEAGWPVVPGGRQALWAVRRAVDRCRLAGRCLVWVVRSAGGRVVLVPLFPWGPRMRLRAGAGRRSPGPDRPGRVFVHRLGCDPGLVRLRALVEPGDVVCDIGAGAGLAALCLGHWVGPTGRVHALEADDALCGELEANLVANPGLPVRAYGVGLAGPQAPAPPPPVVIDLVAAAAPGRGRVEVRLDDWGREVGLGRVDLIRLSRRVDPVEVLTGGERLLRAWMPLVVCDPGPAAGAAARLLDEVGYTRVEFDPAGVGSGEGAGFVALHPGSRWVGRLAAAARSRAPGRAAESVTPVVPVAAAAAR